ncbi:FecR domain-containing protein [Brevundimonas diminuta]|uniref:FecR family protein n=1 Tax=Brevundimonas diminuta TaxID=293 RepID=UPI0020983CDC|nr:FecR domain-containing protein [Brevundimonas diminuta]MCO8029908.1 FecR domain-containing protein [Brevundimonas diminuta]
MSHPKNRVEASETEAAAWHARLGARSVSTETIEDFFAWRSKPGNADAYRRVERVWGAAGRLEKDPEIARAFSEALSRKDSAARPRRLGRAVIGAAIGGAVMAAAVAGALWLQSRTVFATAVGEQRVVQLADGSNVRLDTDSRIRVRFDGDRRLVELEDGQALFTVAHDGDRPFVVLTDDIQVTAVGTVFDVRRDSSGVKVTLVSGVVDVAERAAGRAVKRLAAGQQSQLTPQGQVTRAVDIQAETSWTDGRIVFRDTPLRDAVSEVNRYLTHKIVLDAAAQEAASVNGVFRTGDRDAFVSTAAEVFGLRAKKGVDGEVLLSDAKKSRGAPGSPGA